MSNTIVKSPKTIIAESIIASSHIQKDNFLVIINRLYQFEILKPLLDLCATLAQQGRLKFKIEPKEFYRLENGSCVTIFKNDKNEYMIKIHSIASDTIVHEIAHMLENECKLHLDQEFRYQIFSDLQDSNTSNISLKSAVKQIMIDELKPYPKNHIDSELFARYFQLIAMSYEIAGKASQYGYTIKDLFMFFSNFTSWLTTKLFSKISNYVNYNIAYISESYVVPVDQIKSNWTDEKVRPALEKNDKGKTSWSRNIKSNFEN